MPEYRLRGRRVVVRADVPGERLGSIYVPEVARRQPLVGTVVLVGHQVTEVAPGDRVMFGHHTWSRWAPLGFPHVLLWERDLLAVLETT